MIPLTLPKDTLLHLDPSVVAEVRPPLDGQPLAVTVRPAPEKRRTASRVVALLLGAGAGGALGFAAGGAWTDPAAATDRSDIAARPRDVPPPQRLPPAPEPGAAAAPRPPATVVRPNAPATPSPQVDPFGLTR